MITTVTLNAAIDKTYYLSSFPLGRVSRVRRMFAEPGGKGINVARVIHQLGYPVTATGFLGGYNGEWICNALGKQGIANDFVQIEGESRLCLNMIDEATGVSTEVLEGGASIPQEAIEQLIVKVKRLAAQSKIVCISGSLPNGIPDDFYAELIEIVKKAGALAFLDTSGASLRNGIRAIPYFTKPNEDEIVQLLGTQMELDMSKDMADVQQVLKEQLISLYDKGIPTVTVSLGSQGSLTSVEGAVFRAKAPRIDVVNTVGCGDAFVAGMAIATAGELPANERIAYATAVGSANALTEKAGYVNKLDVQRLFSDIAVEQI
ncbi:1-phosphofructokinase family hexose kinase [Paenibacillus sp. UNC451MF]|uniref:1-phosphofructokinase family hexose kinase n=1 Tax=Paenibacillus sp. UNC451MF TaxID=1449063 RepID=UPI00048DF567|nr:1-phosphofructokinase family hexose kinase [Paenibacillus sp. UNC451MF]